MYISLGGTLIKLTNKGINVMRKAKEVKIYNNIEDVFVGTIKEFCEQHPTVTRRNLYRPGGSVDQDTGITWRLDAIPENTKEIADSGNLLFMSLIERNLEQYETTKVNNLSPTIEEQKKILRCHRANLIIIGEKEEKRIQMEELLATL